MEQAVDQVLGNPCHPHLTFLCSPAQILSNVGALIIRINFWDPFY